MDVSAVGHTGHGHEVQAKAAAKPQEPPPPPPSEGDSVEFSSDAKTLSAASVLDE